MIDSRTTELLASLLANLTIKSMEALLAQLHSVATQIPHYYLSKKQTQRRPSRLRQSIARVPQSHTRLRRPASSSKPLNKLSENAFESATFHAPPPTLLGKRSILNPLNGQRSAHSRSRSVHNKRFNLILELPRVSAVQVLDSL